MDSEKEDASGTHTREIRRIVQRVAGEVLPSLVAEAWKHQESKCSEHQKTLQEFTKSMNGLSEKVAVLIEKKEDIKVAEKELFEGKNKNAQDIVKIAKDHEFLAKEQFKMETKVTGLEDVVEEISLSTGDNTKAIARIDKTHEQEKELKIKEAQDTRTIKWTAIIAIGTVVAGWLWELGKPLIKTIANHIK